MSRSFIPPLMVSRAAQRGLRLRSSLPPSKRCCTRIGLVRGRQLAVRRPVSLRTIKRMKAYFDRHEIDRQAREWGTTSKGWQAWLMWGGDAGRQWAERILQDET